MISKCHCQAVFKLGNILRVDINELHGVLQHIVYLFSNRERI